MSPATFRPFCLGLNMKDSIKLASFVLHIMKYFASGSKSNKSALVQIIAEVILGRCLIDVDP